MEEKYTYRSDLVTPYLYLLTILSFVFWAMIIEALDRANTGCLIVLSGLFILSILLFFMLNCVPVTIKANENAIDYTIFWLKKGHIPYSLIKSIEVEREFREPEIRGDQKHYDERMKIICGDVSYDFQCQMDIDFAALTNDPGSLEKQFENGRFMRLKKYIENQMIKN